jgi:hypothetical protein
MFDQVLCWCFSTGTMGLIGDQSLTITYGLKNFSGRQQIVMLLNMHSKRKKLMK